MSSSNSGSGAPEPHAGIVVVPRAPGPLRRIPAEGRGRRHRDELDELIDDLLPDTEAGPGAFDAALVGGGLAVLGWAAVGRPPGMVVVSGVVSLGLGAILPVRAVWRRVEARRTARWRAGILGGGTPLRTTDPVVASMVGIYDRLCAGASVPAEARAAAHGALLDVASLLEGRDPSSEREAQYVAVRAAAVAEMWAALEELQAPTPALPEGLATGLEPDLVVEAREELDPGSVSLARLDDITEEIRSRARRR